MVWGISTVAEALVSIVLEEEEESLYGYTSISSEITNKVSIRFKVQMLIAAV